MYNNNILNIEKSMPNLNACTKKVSKLFEGNHVYLYTDFLTVVYRILLYQPASRRNEKWREYGMIKNTF